MQLEAAKGIHYDACVMRDWRLVTCYRYGALSSVSSSDELNKQVLSSVAERLVCL